MEPTVDRSAILRDVSSAIAAAESSLREETVSPAVADSMSSAELVSFLSSLHALQAAVNELGRPARELPGANDGQSGQRDPL